MADSPWMRTTWFGGCNNRESDRAGRVLAPSSGTAVFKHDARVRRLPGGTVEGEYYADTEIRRLGNGSFVVVPVKEPRWQRFNGGLIPAALLAQAEEEVTRA